MDFADTAEEAAFRAEVAAWLKQVTTPRDQPLAPAQSLEVRLERARTFQRSKAERGFAALTLPRSYGGGGMTPIQQVIYLQEEQRYHNFDVAEIFGVGLGMCLPTILHNGTEAQCERYIAPAIRGDEIWCQLFSEPSGGSDVAAARTSAIRDGDDWVISGQKTWTSGAHFSDFGILTTRTDPDLPKHRGMTMFIVDMRAPGIEVRPIRQLSDESDFNEVFFTDVRVPDSFRLGEINNGWNVALSTLLHERAGIGARSEALNWKTLLQFAAEHTLGGEPADLDDEIGDRVVDAWLTEFGCQLLAFRGQTALSRGEAPGPEQSVMKMLKAPMLQQHAYLAMELLGEGGLLTSETLGPAWRGVEKAWTFGAAIRIAGGSDEILRNIVAERVLGLPPDVRLDKGVPFKEVPV